MHRRSLPSFLEDSIEKVMEGGWWERDGRASPDDILNHERCSCGRPSTVLGERALAQGHTRGMEPRLRHPFCVCDLLSLSMETITSLCV